MTGQHDAAEAAAALARPCPPRPRGCGARPGQQCWREALDGNRIPIHGPGHAARLIPTEGT